MSGNTAEYKAYISGGCVTQKRKIDRYLTALPLQRLQFCFAGLLIPGPSNRAVYGIGFDPLDAEIVGSNAAQGMDVCHRLSVLYSHVWIETFATG
jgi:hypothetical protein